MLRFATKEAIKHATRITARGGRALVQRIKLTQINTKRRTAAHAVGTSPLKGVGSGRTSVFQVNNSTHRGDLPCKGDRLRVHERV